MRAYLSKTPWVSLIFCFSAAASIAQNAEPARQPRQPVAIVEGQTIYYDDLITSIKAQFAPVAKSRV
jgi:hypothetical protein